jgi:uroporphyrinogen-III synthase
LLTVYVMPQHKIQILSTKSLPGSLIKEVSPEALIVEAIPFIETEPLQTVEVQQEIEQASVQSITVIFTSKNAVDAVVAGLEDMQPDWGIYCIGHATREAVIAYFGEEKILGMADNAAELAALIVDEAGIDEAIFFCGNQRRDELPEILASHEIEVHEIIVYQTIAVPKKITKKYDGILFFSPSAVDSFFTINKPMPDTILFAIGNTTSNRIRKYSANKIIISKSPDRAHMIREVVNYFS